MKQRKRTLSLLFIFILILLPQAIIAQEPIQLWINGNYVKSDVSPVLEESRTLVPVRIITENLGFGVKWDPQYPKIVTIYKGDENNMSYFLSLTIDEKTAILNDTGLPGNEREIPLDVPPKIIQERTFVPIRFIAEQFGTKVNWDEKNRTAIIGEGYQSPPEIMKTSETVIVNPNINQQFVADTTQGVIKGNRKSKIYHVPGGASYNKISVKNVVYFNSEEEAQAAGYRRAKR